MLPTRPPMDAAQLAAFFPDHPPADLPDENLRYFLGEAIEKCLWRNCDAESRFQLQDAEGYNSGMLITHGGRYYLIRVADMGLAVVDPNELIEDLPSTFFEGEKIVAGDAGEELHAAISAV